jgi:hypothetical protein
MSLQAKLDAFKADFRSRQTALQGTSIARAVIDTMHRATDELIASGAATQLC